MSREKISKVIHEKLPPDLEERVTNLNKYPTSPSFAGNLYKTGISIVKENGLYRSVGKYNAELRYVPFGDPTLAVLRFKKFGVFADSIRVDIIKPDECIGSGVIARMGARLTVDLTDDPISIFNYESFSDFVEAAFGKYPVVTGVLNTTIKNKSENNELTLYNLYSWD